MTVFDLIRNTLMAGFGVQERLREFIDDLVRKGELSESQGARLVKEWIDLAERSRSELTRNVSDLVARTLDTMNLATKSDMEGVNKKTQELAARLEKLEGREKTSG